MQQEEEALGMVAVIAVVLVKEARTWNAHCHVDARVCRQHGLRAQALGHDALHILSLRKLHVF